MRNKKKFLLIIIIWEGEKELEYLDMLIYKKQILNYIVWKCHKKSDNVNIEEVKTKNGRMIKNAKICNTTKFCFISSKKSNYDEVEIKPQSIKTI